MQQGDAIYESKADDVFDELDPATQRSPVTQQELDILYRALGDIEAMILKLGDVDAARGSCGIKDKRARCLWTTTGRRITLMFLTGGGLLGTLSRDPDPAYNRIIT